MYKLWLNLKISNEKKNFYGILTVKSLAADDVAASVITNKIVALFILSFKSTEFVTFSALLLEFIYVDYVVLIKIQYHISFARWRSANIMQPQILSAL